MKCLFRLLPFFVFGCSGPVEEEMMSRAINDEAMQEVNRLFDAGNRNLYGNVERYVAVRVATKEELPDLAIYKEISRRFLSAKKLVDATQTKWTETYGLVEFTPGEHYRTRSVIALSSNADFNMSALADSILSCISTARDILQNDTTCRLFSGLEAGQFIQNRSYKYDAFSAEITALLDDFKTAFPTADSHHELIDVLEFFTLCRSTLLLAERKALRFHNETVLTVSRSRLTDELITIVETDNISYAPGASIRLDVFPVLLFDENYSTLHYSIDSNPSVFRGMAPGFICDTIFLPTETTGNHSVETKHTTKQGRKKETATHTYHYRVIEK